MKKKTLIGIIAASGIVFKIITAHLTIKYHETIYELYNKHISPRITHSQTLEEQMNNTFKDRENKIYISY